MASKLKHVIKMELYGALKQHCFDFHLYRFWFCLCYSS